MDKQWKSDRVYARADLALVDYYLRIEKNETSRSKVQRWFELNLVRRVGQSLRVADRISVGDVLVWTVPEATALPLAEVEINIPDVQILFEDDDLAIVNKPPGISVHPSESEAAKGPTVTLVHMLQKQLKSLSGVGGVLRPGIVHRIDKWTSGSLVVSKNDWTHEKLSSLFAEHTIDRVYWALAYGDLKQPKVVQSLIGRSPTDRKKMSTKVTKGRNAESAFRPLARFGDPVFATWVEAKLKTGRTHQIRVHLSDLKHSLMGDPTYGIPSSKNPKWLALPESVQSCVRALGGQALHARTLGFVHPRTEKSILVEAEPFPAFRALKELLETFRA